MKILFESSTLDSGQYDSAMQVLTIDFKSGTRYKFYDVPVQVWESLKTADSAGRFFHANVRNVYTFKVRQGDSNVYI